MTDGYRNEALAAALARTDVSAIGDAVRAGRVVVPLLDHGRVRVFPGEHGYEVMVFSSVDSLSLFLADDDNRLARLQGGEELRTFLASNREEIAHVTFDPAGPHPLRTGLGEVLTALGPRRWVGLRLPKAQEWYPVDLSTNDLRDYRLADLKQRVLPKVVKGPLELPVWQAWMTEAAEQASARGAASLAFWLQRVARRPAGLSVCLRQPLLGAEPYGPHGPAGNAGPTAGERWVTSPDAAYQAWLGYSFPQPDLAETVLPTVDLVAATLAWGEEEPDDEPAR